MAKKKVGSVTIYGTSIKPIKVKYTNKLYDNASVQKLQAWAITKFNTTNSTLNTIKHRLIDIQ